MKTGKLVILSAVLIIAAAFTFGIQTQKAQMSEKATAELQNQNLNFDANQLASLFAEPQNDLKCGEGKCGGDKKEAKKDSTDCKKKDCKDKSKKCGEGKCGGDDKKNEKKENKCGEGKCGGSM